MRGVRGSLIGAGAAIAGYGVLLLAEALTLPQLTWLAVWLAAVLIVHDAVLAPAVSWLRRGWYRASGSRPAAVTAIVHIGFVVGGVLTLFVIPEIWAQARGNPNPTILVGDYAARLLAVWAVLAVVVLAASRVVIRRERRRSE